MGKRLPAAREPVVTSRIMAAVRSKDTRPELLLRKELFRLGLRYRLHAAGLPGKPDIVFPGPKVAVFVDGDFWHGWGWKERGYLTLEDQFGSRRDFWTKKLRRNMERDAEVNHILDAAGWLVLRYFASEVSSSPSNIAGQVSRAVRARFERE